MGGKMNKYWLKIFFLGFFAFFPIFSVHAEITAQVEPPKVSVGETFRLILTAEGEQSDKLPDLTALQEHFIIVGTERSMSYTIVNGKAHSMQQWVILLQAKEAGVITIPAIQFGQEKSQEIRIEVRGEQEATQPVEEPAHDEKVMLKTEVSQKNPFINQQVIYTVKLYNSGRLLDAEYHPPHVENALIITLGDAKHYQTVENGIHYVVEEQQYAIFPQKSGKLTITGPAFNALVYDGVPRQVNIRPKQTNLAVKPIPSNFQGQYWLPAKKVTLHDTYASQDDKIEEGSTLIRTVNIETVGLPAQLVPKLEFIAGQSYSAYPEPSIEQNVIRQGELVGKTSIKVTYIFNQAGEVTIPELKLTWFNTDTRQEETAVLSAKIIHVAQGATAKQDVNQNKLTATNGHRADMREEPPEKEQKPLQVPANSSYWAWILAILFALAWLLTLLLWLFRPYLFPSRAKSRALKRLKIACFSNNPALARDALLAWAALQWPDAEILNLNDLQKLIHDQKLKKQCHFLSQALYSREKGIQWHGPELWQAVSAYDIRRFKVRSGTGNLPPINPIH